MVWARIGVKSGLRFDGMIFLFLKKIWFRFRFEEIRTSFRVMKMTRTVFENKSGDQYTKDSV